MLLGLRWYVIYNKKSDNYRIFLLDNGSKIKTNFQVPTPLKNVYNTL